MATAQATEESKKEEAALIAAIAALIAVNASSKATGEKIATLMKAPVGLVVAVVTLALSEPLQVGGVWTPSRTGEGGAEDIVRARAPFYRSAYIENAVKRVHENVRKGSTLEDSIDRERTFFRQHITSQRNRVRAARDVDRAASRFGLLLGWYTTMDSRTSPECLAANGKNFRVDDIPTIGYPGAVHAFCRCKAGRPHRRAALLATATGKAA